MLHVHAILHPTDFSLHSQHAFWLACGLAADYRARLIALHVLELPVIAYANGVAMPPDVGVLRAAAQEHLNGLRASRPDVQLERRLVEGSTGEEILRAAGEDRADLIVMGTHGRAGLGRLLLGSVAEHVMRRARCPVLTVKAPEDTASPEDVEEGRTPRISTAR